MLSAKEHPDTAETTFDVSLAHLAITFAFLTIIVPAVVAALR